MSLQRGGESVTLKRKGWHVAHRIEVKVLARRFDCWARIEPETGLALWLSPMMPSGYACMVWYDGRWWRMYKQRVEGLDQAKRAAMQGVRRWISEPEAGAGRPTRTPTTSEIHDTF